MKKLLTFFATISISAFSNGFVESCSAFNKKVGIDFDEKNPLTSMENAFNINTFDVIYIKNLTKGDVVGDVLNYKNLVKNNDVFSQIKKIFESKFNNPKIFKTWFDNNVLEENLNYDWSGINPDSNKKLLGYAMDNDINIGDIFSKRIQINLNDQSQNFNFSFSIGTESASTFKAYDSTNGDSSLLVGDLDFIYLYDNFESQNKSIVDELSKTTPGSEKYTYYYSIYLNNLSIAIFVANEQLQINYIQYYDESANKIYSVTDAIYNDLMTHGNQGVKITSDKLVFDNIDDHSIDIKYIESNY